jgi:hypothetical protein
MTIILDFLPVNVGLEYFMSKAVAKDAIYCGLGTIVSDLGC